MKKLKKWRLVSALFCAALLVLSGCGTSPKGSTSDGISYEIVGSGSSQTVIITGYTGSATRLPIPETIKKLRVVTIGDGAFADCKSLTSVSIPASVTSIRDRAFLRCSSLTSVSIPTSVTSIGDSAFAECSSLTSVSIPASVTSIGDSAFAECSSLTSVSIPTSVTSIGDSAFRRCSSLTSVSIPASVTSIGDSAFAGCGNMTGITVDEGNPNYSSNEDVLFSKDQRTLIQYPGGKSGSYTIPDSVTSIGAGAFSGCKSLTGITVDEGNPNYSSNEDVLFSKDQRTLIQYPGGKSGSSYNIPISVTSIGDSAFEGCMSLNSVSIPASVTKIGRWAFDGCESLNSVTIPASVKEIGNWTFKGCKSLTGVDIPVSVTKIGNGAFEGCKSLTSVSIPVSVTSIGAGAFSGCDSLKNVTLSRQTKVEQDTFPKAAVPSYSD